MITESGNQSTLNFLSGNRAVFTLPDISDTAFSVNGFDIPAISLPPASQATQNISKPRAGETLIFSDLTINFVVRADMENWKELYDWLRNLGAPYWKKEEYLKRYPTHADAYITIYSAKNNPIMRLTFVDAFPIELGSISFSEEIQETTTVNCSATFAYERYDIEVL